MRNSPPSRDFVHHVLDRNLEDKFELLRGTPGICLDPQSWENIKQLIYGNSEEDLGSLGRHPSGIVQYRQFRKQIAKEFTSVEDYVASKVLGYPCSFGADGRRTAREPSRPPEKRPIWRLNDFPYNFEEGVMHHNIWSEVPLSHEEILKEIQKHREGWESLYWVNPPPLASIPTIWHAHVVSKRKA